MNLTRRLLGSIALVALLSPNALAAGPAAATPTVERAWARATAPGATMGAAYLVIDNRGRRADRLLSISTPRAESAQVHVTIRELDQVRMRRVDPLHIAAGERLVLEPGGTHVMLMGLRSPLLAGEKLPLTLRFETGGDVKVEASVVAASPAATDPHAHHAQ